MKVYIYNKGGSLLAELCEQVLNQKDCIIAESPVGCELGIAPWLNRKISQSDLNAFRYGVLVFHPSLLPLYKGKNAIKDCFKAGESYSGATWFWANDQLDGGDICEQVVIAIHQATPRDFYTTQVIPKAVQLLGYILHDLSRGIIRRRPQD